MHSEKNKWSNLSTKRNKRKVIFLGLITVIISLVSILFLTSKLANAEQGSYVPGKAIICVKESKNEILQNPQMPLSFIQNLDDCQAGQQKSLDYTVDEELITLDQSMSFKNSIEESGNEIVNLPNNICLLQKIQDTTNDESCKILRVNCNDTDKFVEEANKSNEILWAQPDYLMKPYSLPQVSKTYGYKDPGFPYQWGYQDAETSPFGINAPEYWEQDSSNPNDHQAIVAVLDTGVDYTHEDLKDNICDELDIEPLRNIGGGKYGYNTVVDDGVLDTSNPMDRGSHGTHCAAAIAGQFNDLGIRGANGAHAKIVPCRFLGPNGGAISQALKCYNYIIAARQNGVNISVVSNSWGDTDPHTLPNYALDSVLNKAGENGIMSVFAAGNDSRDLDYYASSFNNSKYVLTIGASDDLGQSAFFSNYSKRVVDFFAPGVQMLSACTSFVPDPKANDERSFFPYINSAKDVFFDIDFSNEANSDIDDNSQVKICAVQKAAEPAQETGSGVQGLDNNVIRANADYTNNSASFDFSNFSSENPISIYFHIPKSVCPEMFENGVTPYVYGNIEYSGIEFAQNYIPFMYPDSEGYAKRLGEESYAILCLHGHNEFTYKITDTDFLNTDEDAITFIAMVIPRPGSDLSSAKFAFSNFTFAKNPSNYCLMSGTSMACPVAAAIASVVTGYENPQNGEDVIRCMDIVKGTTSYSKPLINKAKIPSVGNIYSAYKYENGDKSVLHPVINDVKYEILDETHINFKLAGRFFDSVINHEDLTKNIGFCIDNHVSAFPTEITNWTDEDIDFTIEMPNSLKVGSIQGKTVAVYLFYGENKISTGYVDLQPKDTDLYTTLTTPDFTYNEPEYDLTYSSADLNPLRMASTNSSAYCLMTQNTHDDQFSIQMIKYSYNDQNWTGIDLSELGMETSFYDGKSEYDQRQFSMASGKDEIYLLYNKVFQNNNDYHLATYSEVENRWIYDISLSEVAQKGDMICNYNGQLLLAGKNHYLEDDQIHRNVDIVKIYPDKDNKFKNMGNLPDFDKSVSSDMHIDEDTPKFDDIAYGDMTVYENDIFITNRICDTDKGEIDVPVRFNGQDIKNQDNWTETLPNWYTYYMPEQQAFITASGATKNGFVEIGNLIITPGIAPTDTIMYHSDVDSYIFHHQRMFPSKMAALAGVCHNNCLYVLGKNYFENSLMFRVWDLSSIEDESQNVDWNVERHNVPATINSDSTHPGSDIDGNNDGYTPKEPNVLENGDINNSVSISNANVSQTTQAEIQTANQSELDNNTTAQTGDIMYVLIIALLVAAITTGFVVSYKTYRKDL